MPALSEEEKRRRRECQRKSEELKETEHQAIKAMAFLPFLSLSRARKTAPAKPPRVRVDVQRDCLAQDVRESHVGEKEKGANPLFFLSSSLSLPWQRKKTGGELIFIPRERRKKKKRLKGTEERKSDNAFSFSFVNSSSLFFFLC